MTDDRREDATTDDDRGSADDRPDLDESGSRGDPDGAAAGDGPDRPPGGDDPDDPPVGGGRHRPSGDDPDEPLGDVAARVRERAGDAVDPSRREGPMADVASEVDERRRRDRSSDDAFESIEVGELDGEQLWERLAEGDDAPTATVPPGETVEVEDGDEWAGRDVRTIPKATCHGCPHFGDPPELACTHEGTAILAMTDTDHFRVVDCPVVVEEEVGDISVGDVESEGADGVAAEDRTGTEPADAGGGSASDDGSTNGDGPAEAFEGDGAFEDR